MVKRKFSLSGPGKTINLIKGPLGVLIAIKLYKLGKELTQDLEVKALWSITIPLVESSARGTLWGLNK